MMDAIHIGWFERMNDQVARRSLKKARDGKKKLFIHRDPFRDLLLVFVIKNARNALFNKVNVIGNAMFAEEEKIFGR